MTTQKRRAASQQPCAIVRHDADKYAGDTLDGPVAPIIAPIDALTNVKAPTNARRLSKGYRLALAGVAVAGALSFIGADALTNVSHAVGRLDATDANGRPQTCGQRCLELIEQFEGYKLDGYLLGDGKCTIGYGHAVDLSLISKADCKAWHITDKEAEEFLMQDTERFANEINSYFTRSFTQNQFDALVSFSYNVGYAFEKYSWPKDAPDNYFPGVMIQYTNPPKFKEGLKRRRQAEIEVWNNPVDLPSETPTQPPVADEPNGSDGTGGWDSNWPGWKPSDWLNPPVIYTPPAVVSTWPAIPTIFSGGFGAR